MLFSISDTKRAKSYTDDIVPDVAALSPDDRLRSNQGTTLPPPGPSSDGERDVAALTPTGEVEGELSRICCCERSLNKSIHCLSSNTSTMKTDISIDSAVPDAVAVSPDQNSGSGRTTSRSPSETEGGKKEEGELAPSPTHVPRPMRFNVCKQKWEEDDGASHRHRFDKPFFEEDDAIDGYDGGKIPSPSC